MDDLKFDLNDISIIPSVESDVSSRSECDICHSNDMLPLMASPMDTVVSIDNYCDYIRNRIIPCLPRKTRVKEDFYFKKHHYFQAFGLCEIEKQMIISSYGEQYVEGEPFYKFPNVLIDISNGHMKKLIDIIKQIKQRWPDIILMVGNVAHPETFVNLAKAGADYVRISIGTGAGCTTAANVSINYPIGSLISECKNQKIELGLKKNRGPWRNEKLLRYY